MTANIHYNFQFLNLFDDFHLFHARVCVFQKSGGVFMCLNPADGNGPNSHFIFAALETFV